ncbi:MAG: hypothetical protein S4CHLAM20_06060 [Chlamydiia bacterium]|nr:hypothetical protein [Chlamydiia bacterium]
MATFYQTFSSETSPPKLYTSVITRGKKAAFCKFKDLFHQSAFLHFSFCAFILLGSIVSFSLFLRDQGSLYTPAAFALLFLSIASYGLIAYYQKNRKLDTIDTICKEYRRYCYQKLSTNIEDSEKLHLAIAECLRDLAESVHDPKLFHLTIHPFKFSKNHLIAHFLYFHYNDILYMQEKLLEISLEQHSYVLADCACSLEFHSSLSKVYSTLATCYKIPKGTHLEKAFSYSTITKATEYQTQFEKYYTLAIEELKIICDISDSEPWTHLELASLYAKFDDSELEMQQYEIIINRVADDKEILYKLGILYFKHHKTSHGLKIYDRLKHIDALYAKNLLAHYNFT